MAYRSMKDYQDVPEDLNIEMALFLIRYPEGISGEILSQLYQFVKTKRSIISLEKLNKGGEKALVIFGPKDLQKDFPNLNLLELEDYLQNPVGTQDLNSQKTSVNNTLAWNIMGKKDPKKELVLAEGFSITNLSENQSFYLQIVCSPLEKPSNSFQVTIRALVLDKDPNLRVALAKNLNETLTENTSLNSSKREETTAKVFGDFYKRSFQHADKRSLVPKNVFEFTLSSEEIARLLKV